MEITFCSEILLQYLACHPAPRQTLISVRLLGDLMQTGMQKTVIRVLKDYTKAKNETLAVNSYAKKEPHDRVAWKSTISMYIIVIWLSASALAHLFATAVAEVRLATTNYMVAPHRLLNQFMAVRTSLPAFLLRELLDARSEGILRARLPRMFMQFTSSTHYHSALGAREGLSSALRGP